MTLVDANVLIYAYDERSREHKLARKWLTDRLVSSTSVCFPWISLMAFVRITTNPKLFSDPYSTDESFDVIENWLSAPGSRIVSPGDEHLALVKQIAKATGLQGADLTDVHLAAIAIEHNLPLATTDRDFLKFDGLRIIDPLAN